MAIAEQARIFSGMNPHECFGVIGWNGSRDDQQTTEKLYQLLKTDTSLQNPSVSLVDFIDRVNSRYHNVFSPDILLQGFLFLKKEQLKSPGNPINFIAQVALGSIDAGVLQHGDVWVNHESVSAYHALQETTSNLLSLVVEHPLAESVKVDRRPPYTWNKDTQRNSQLFLKSRPFNTILEEAIATSQKADFELPRYLANLRAYERLCAGRLKGDSRTFVEISPSPEILTQEAFDRGYRGNSYIGTFEIDKTTGNEQFTQYWFRASWNEVAQLLREIDRSPRSIHDYELMSQSDFMDNAQLTRIMDFIEYKRGQVAVHRDEIVHYANTDLRTYIYEQLAPVLKLAAKKLVSGESVWEEMMIITSTLRFAQNKFNQQVATLGHVPIKYIRVSENEERYFDANPYARLKFVEEKKMPLVGCGSSVQTDKSDSFGINDSRNEEDQFGKLSFKCPNPECKLTIKRPKGKLLSNCPHCGKEIPRC